MENDNNHCVDCGCDISHKEKLCEECKTRDLIECELNYEEGLLQ
jgi:predicted nucleic acid-binding Zn ribbon protein